MTTQALMVQPTSTAAESWEVTKEKAAFFIQSGLLPQSIKTPQQAVVIMLKGRELGLPDLYALSLIGVIGGKPVVAAEVMASLIYRHHGDQALRVVESSATVCTIEYRRRSWAAPQSYSFTIEDAKNAGLLGNQTWQKYPAAMCRARCTSAVARMAFPDVIGGLSTPEEMGAEVSVNADGEVEMVAPPQTQATQAPPAAGRKPLPPTPLQTQRQVRPLTGPVGATPQAPQRVLDKSTGEITEVPFAAQAVLDVPLDDSEQPAPSAAALALYAVLAGQAEAAGAQVFPADDIATAGEMDNAINHLIGFLSGPDQYPDTGKPGADALKNLTVAFATYRKMGVELATPEHLSAAGCTWLLLTLKQVLEVGRARRAAQAVVADDREIVGSPI